MAKEIVDLVDLPIRNGGWNQVSHQLNLVGLEHLVCFFRYWEEFFPTDSYFFRGLGIPPTMNPLDDM